MTQHYSDPAREADPYALPDLDVYFVHRDEIDEENESEEGWFYAFCFPGCLPDSEPVGPFLTEQEALEDARSNSYEDGTDGDGLSKADREAGLPE